MTPMPSGSEGVVEWPKSESSCGCYAWTTSDHRAYERAMKEAALARLHYAVEQLNKAAATFAQAGFLVAAGALHNVVADIGPLPDLPKGGE